MIQICNLGTTHLTCERCGYKWVQRAAEPKNMSKKCGNKKCATTRWNVKQSKKPKK